MLNMAEVQYFGLSDIGGRPRNEDSFLILDNQASANGNQEISYLFAVADGIGGHSAGDVASRMACEGLLGLFQDNSAKRAHSFDPELFGAHLVRTIRNIDSLIGRYAREEEGCAHMGTTLSVLVLTADFGMVAHVGDSRVYLLRGGNLNQLTVDHTFIQDLIDDDELTPEQAAVHPFRHVLTRAVGTQEPLEEISFQNISPEPGDRFLLCTDGLQDTLKPEEIGQILKETDDPERSVRRLIQEANQRRGRDNVTVISISAGSPECVCSPHGHRGAILRG